ncbi:MAG: hypothetical protein K2M48_03645, partial [Clostridiales bacterium]|nr:hypothetical protein [Clostridiales bacterium]
IAYWLAFIIVGALVGSAFIPSFSIGSVTVNAAGFIVPVALAVLFFVLSGKTREAGHSIVAASAVLSVYVAVRLLLSMVVMDTIVSIIAGILCGATAFVVGKTKLAALSGVFAGVPLGVVTSTVVEMISYGTPIQLGSPAVFDVVVLAAVFAVVIFEIVAAVKRASNAKRSVAAEAAEEFDPEEYKKYFDE